MRYSAPWSTSVKVITGGVTLLFLAIGFMIPTLGRAIFGATLLGVALFGPRGYELSNGELVVHRWGWGPARIPLRDLVSVHISPDLTSRSIRTFGNGGLFGFTGWFHSSTLGRYRAWMTDSTHAVAMNFGERGTIVISPGRTNLFAEEVREKTGVEPIFGVPERS